MSYIDIPLDHDQRYQLPNCNLRKKVFDDVFLWNLKVDVHSAK